MSPRRMTYRVTFPGDTYEEAVASFEWGLPDDFNAAYDLVKSARGMA